jgi:hypothetical protein
MKAGGGNAVFPLAVELGMYHLTDWTNKNIYVDTKPLEDTERQ